MGMERKLKLIWDFRGPEAELTAKHHAIHLSEFSKSNNLSLQINGYTQMAPEHWFAYLVVTDSEMKPVRDALKPHRGTIYTENE